MVLWDAGKREGHQGGFVTISPSVPLEDPQVIGGQERGWYLEERPSRCWTLAIGRRAARRRGQHRLRRGVDRRSVV
jgi:hypothetical protein